MPKRLEEALKRSARQHGYEPKTDRYNRYVYGSLEKYKEARHKEAEKSEAARKLKE